MTALCHRVLKKTRKKNCISFSDKKEAARKRILITIRNGVQQRQMDELYDEVNRRCLGRCAVRLNRKFEVDSKVIKFSRPLRMRAKTLQACMAPPVIFAAE